MMWSRVGMVIGLLFVVRAAVAEPTPAPKIHYTACSLAESMASKFGAKKMTADQAKGTCEQLAPAMNDADRAEFMRCCTARLK